MEQIVNIHGHEMHSGSNFLSDFILGSQDGLVNVLGIILGVSAATSNIKLIFVAALAALGAETISMAAVAYTSTAARRKLYLKEAERERQEMRDVPKIERKEVEDVFKAWGYKGKDLQNMTDGIVKNPQAWLEFMMSFELKLSPVEKSQPLHSFIVVGAATIFGSIIPLIPFIFYTGNIGICVAGSVILSGLILFGIGMYEAKTTVGSLWAAGARMAMIGLVAGFAGYLIGYFIGATPI